MLLDLSEEELDHRLIYVEMTFLSSVCPLSQVTQVLEEEICHSTHWNLLKAWNLPSFARVIRIVQRMDQVHSNELGD